MINSWNYMCEYAVIYDEMADFMLGKGKYYWSGDKNIPGPVYPPSVLRAIYNLYETDKELNVLEIFQSTLLKLCKGTPSELEYGVIYFGTHCRNEKVENTSFCFDNNFIDVFMKTVGDRCEKDEKILRNADAHIWRIIVVYNDVLILDTNIKRGYLKSYSIGQAWARKASSLCQIKDMLKGIKRYEFFGIPVDVLKVLQAFYDMDRQNLYGDSDSKIRLQKNFTELLKGDTDDLYLAARYFVYQLSEENKNNASFRFDEEFKNNFIQELSEKCAENEHVFKTEITIYGDNKWQAFKELNDILLNEIGFRQGFLKSN